MLPALVHPVIVQLNHNQLNDGFPLEDILEFINAVDNNNIWTQQLVLPLCKYIGSLSELEYQQFIGQFLAIFNQNHYLAPPIAADVRLKVDIRHLFHILKVMTSIRQLMGPKFHLKLPPKQEWSADTEFTHYFSTLAIRFGDMIMIAYRFLGRSSVHHITHGDGVPAGYNYYWFTRNEFNPLTPLRNIRTPLQFNDAFTDCRSGFYGTEATEHEKPNRILKQSYRPEFPVTNFVQVNHY